MKEGTKVFKTGNEFIQHEGEGKKEDEEYTAETDPHG
jgi:hypothetical protein